MRLPSSKASAVPTGRPLSTYLTRLILACVLPLLLLGAWLSYDNIHRTQLELNDDAAALATNVANSFDQSLLSRIRALQMLAASPLLDTPGRWSELHREAQGFHENFGSHVILASADEPIQMLFHTKFPFGTQLPLLPRPKGHAAAPEVLATGKPAVGDLVFGPAIKAPLVAIAVPALREGKITRILLTVYETTAFQKHLDAFQAPSHWLISVFDSRGELIARRAPPGMPPADKLPTGRRFTVKSTVAPWSVVVEIPRKSYLAPLISAATALTAGLGIALLGSLWGALLLRRTIIRSVNSLSSTAPDNASVEILEVEQTRQTIAAATEKLRAAKVQFQDLYDNAPNGYLSVGTDGLIKRFNKRFAEIVGHAPATLSGIPVASLYADTPDGRLKAQQVFRRFVSGEIIHGEELQMQRADGTLIWINLSVNAVHDADGQILESRSIVQDITERKQAEAALKKSEQEFRSLAESMPQIVWATRPDGWNIYFNHQWVDYTGLSLEESFGHGWNKPFHPDDQQRAWDAWQNATQNLATYSLECRLRRADGVYRWWLVRGVPLLDPDGTILKWFGTCTEIEELKESELELEKHRHHLEELVKERTRELETANQELEAFSYSVSHDLRAPLRAIDGFSLALQEDYGDEFDATAHDYLERVRRATQRMGELIDDLLQLSRIGRSELHRETVDLSAMARAIAAELAEQQPDRPVVWDIENGIVETADFNLLKIALVNLLDNAWKFTSKVSGARISLKRSVWQGQPAICVADNGVGFEMQYVDRLFKPFQRLHSDNEFPGTGIGLALVQRIIHRHCGKVAAEGEPGKGSRFYFTIGGEHECVKDHPAG